MRTTLSAGLLLACITALPASALAAVPTTGLEPFDYSEMTLLRVSIGKGDAAACFFAQHDHVEPGVYVWIRPHETLGNRFGEVDTISKTGVAIRQTQPVNHADYIAINFTWPIAKTDEAKKKASTCGDKPPPPPAVRKKP